MYPVAVQADVFDTLYESEPWNPNDTSFKHPLGTEMEVGAAENYDLGSFCQRTPSEN